VVFKIEKLKIQYKQKKRYFVYGLLPYSKINILINERI